MGYTNLPFSVLFIQQASTQRYRNTNHPENRVKSTNNALTEWGTQTSHSVCYLYNKLLHNVTTTLTIHGNRVKSTNNALTEWGTQTSYSVCYLYNKLLHNVTATLTIQKTE